MPTAAKTDRIIVELAPPLVEQLTRHGMLDEPFEFADLRALIADGRVTGLDRLGQILNQHPELSTRQVSNYSIRDQAKHASAKNLRRRRTPSGLIGFFVLDTASLGGPDRERLLAALQALPDDVIASASLEEMHVSATGTVDLKHGLGYRGPLGVDADGVPFGGGGAGVAVIDLSSFNLRHEAFVHVAPPDRLCPEGTVDSNPASPHATNALAVIVGRSTVMQGIAPEAQVRALVTPEPTGVSVAQAIEDIAYVLDPGDVLLMPIQNHNSLPSESGSREVFAAVHLATSFGIVVVAAAGDQGVDIDEPASHPTRLWFAKADGADVVEGTRVLDSGAILAGGCNNAALPSGAHTITGGFSNFGRRVDCFAWGSAVYTAGSDHNPILPLFTSDGLGSHSGDRNRWYRAFSSSSSASAIVAGVACLVQEMADKAFRPPLQDDRVGLSPRQLRALLRERGTSGPNGKWVVDDDGAPIGVIPSVRKLQARIDSLPRLWVQLTPSETFGDERSIDLGRPAASPAITLGNNAATIAKTATELWIDIHNKGDGDAVKVFSTVYWSPRTSTHSGTRRWTELTAVAKPGDIPAGGMARFGPITVTAEDGVHAIDGEIDILAVAGNDIDPRPRIPTKLTRRRDGMTDDELFRFLVGNAASGLRTFSVS